MTVTPVSTRLSLNSPVRKYLGKADLYRQVDTIKVNRDFSKEQQKSLRDSSLVVAIQLQLRVLDQVQISGYGVSIGL